MDNLDHHWNSGGIFPMTAEYSPWLRQAVTTDDVKSGDETMVQLMDTPKRIRVIAHRDMGKNTVILIPEWC